jgi:DNA topoisomerase VI subunit A
MAVPTCSYSLGVLCWAENIIAVEKESVFQSLVASGLFHSESCVLVTGKGTR